MATGSLTTRIENAADAVIGIVLDLKDAALATKRDKAKALGWKGPFSGK